MSKLNAALSYGGLPLMVATVENYAGVRIDHLVEIDFDGLIAVVDALGGITMDVEPAAGQENLVSIHKPYRELYVYLFDRRRGTRLRTAAQTVRRG